MGDPIVGILIGASLVAMVAVLPRRTVHSPLVSAFRALFPSWRFFGAPSLHVNLHWRAIHPGPDGPRTSPWRAALTVAPRSALGCLWNPRATARLAEESLLRDLLEEAERLPSTARAQLREHVTYRLVEDIVIASVRDAMAGDPDAFDAGVARFEFEVRSRSEREAHESTHLVSPAFAIADPAREQEDAR